MSSTKRAQKRQKIAKTSKKARQPVTYVLGSAPDPSAIDNESDKDDEERQLEAMLFGKPFTPRGDHKKQKGKETERTATEPDDTGLDHVLDTDLFFFDDPPAADVNSLISPKSLLDSSKGLESEVEEGDTSEDDPQLEGNAAPEPQVFPLKSSKKGPAWFDPSDAHISVSLASDNRLRKLRDGLTEDQVSGKQYEAKLRRQFEKTNPTPAWATAARDKLRGKLPKKRRRSSASSGSQSSEPQLEDGGSTSIPDVADLLTSTGGILTSSVRPTLLPPTSISIERLRDANQAAQTEGEVKTVRFHPSPTVPVLLTTGSDRRLRLFNVDGLTNPLIQTVHIPTLPLTTAHFHPSGSSVLLTGPRPFYFTYDLQSGTAQQSPRGLWTASSTNGTGSSDNDRSMEKCRFSDDGKLVAIAGRRGYVHLLDWSSGGSGQIIGSVKMNGAVQDLAWNGSERKELLTMSEHGEMYIWDVGSRRCIRKWKDDGAYGARVLERGGSGKYYAVGSSTGIVNVYGTAAGSSSLSSSPKETPLKALTNLTTPITTVRFDRSVQMMAMASKSKKDQLRLVHLPSLTTFANWPTSGTPLGRVTAVDFSAGSEYLAIGNHRGRVLLYNLRHFGTR